MDDATPKEATVVLSIPRKELRKKSQLLRVINGTGFRRQKQLTKLIRPALRAQLGWLCLCVLSAFFVVRASALIPGSWLHVPISLRPGGLFSWEYTFHFPLLGLIPIIILLRAIWPVMNSEYVVDSRGLESREGILWFNLRQPRLRYEDIRGVEVKQSILDRVLLIGDIVVGSAASHDEGEIVLRRVSHPQGIQLLIQKAIDRKKRSLARSHIIGGNRTGSTNKKRVGNASDLFDDD